MTIDIPFWFTALASSEVDAELGGSGSILFNLLIILLLVFLNGFFVASEFALVKVRSSQLDALEDGRQEGGAGAACDVASGRLSFRDPAWDHARESGAWMDRRTLPGQADSSSADGFWNEI